jgi:hypothetical protein
LRQVTARWKINSLPADAANCAAFDRLTLEFTNRAGQSYFSVAPVPCVAGSFSIDKMPLQIQRSDIIADTIAGTSFDATAEFDRDGVAKLNIIAPK